MTTSRSHGEHRITRPIILFLLASVLPTLLSCGLDVHHGLRTGSIANGFPWADAGDRFTDVMNYQTRFGYLHSERFFATNGYFWASYAFVYPMFAAVVCAALFSFGPHALAAYLITTIAGFVFTTIAFASKIANGFEQRWKAYILVALTALTSFPIFFLIMRGNIEDFGFFLVAGAIWAYCESRWTICALLIGLAMAFKLFPFILIALLFSEKRYREGGIALLTFFFVETSSCAFVGPTLPRAARGMAKGLEFFKNYYAYPILPETQWDHSLFSLLKVARATLHRHSGQLSPAFLSTYLVGATILGLLFYWFHLRRLPRHNQIVVLVALSILLPPVSFLYTLTHMYVVWAVLLIYLLRESPTPAVRNTITIVMLFLGLACADLDFVRFRGYGFGGQLQALCLIAIVVIASFKRWPSSQAFGHPADRPLMP